jgi:hypothetical protein
MGFHVFQKVFIGSAYVALLVYTKGLLLFPGSVANLSGEIQIADRKQSCIYVVVDGSFIQHDDVCIVAADLVDRLSLLDQRRNNVVNSTQFGRLGSKALAAFTADSLVLTLRKLCIIEMPSEFAVTSFLASVADIRWFVKLETYHLLKILTGSKALDLIALPTKLSEFLLTWIADVRKMLALPAMTARIKGFFFYDLVVTSYLFGDS